MKRSELKKIIKEAAVDVMKERITVSNSIPSGKDVYAYLKTIDDTSLTAQQRVDKLISAVKTWNEKKRGTKAGKYNPKVIVKNYFNSIKKDAIAEQEGDNFFDFKAIKKELQGQQSINESFSGDPEMWLSAALLAPHFGQGIATVIEKLKRTFGKYTTQEIDNLKKQNYIAAKDGGHKHFKSKIAEWINNVAHKAHGFIMKPLNLVLLLLSKFEKFSPLRDKNVREKFGNLIYSALLIAWITVTLSQHGGVHDMLGAGEALKIGDLVLDSALALSTLKELSPNDKSKVNAFVHKILKAIHL